MKWFWILFHKKFGKPGEHFLHFPVGLLSRFDYHYFLYDDNGDVKDGAANMLSAIRKAKQSGLYISRCWG